MMSKIARSQLLSTLLINIPVFPSLSGDVVVSSISLDSQQVKAGGLFFAMAKDSRQRIKHIKQALDLGAKVLLVDDAHRLTEKEQQIVRRYKAEVHAIKELTENVGDIAARFYDYPSSALTVIAVTGTNGKTSVSQFIAQSFEFLGIPCGVVGTLGYGRIDAMKDTGMTTPDPVTLHTILADFQQRGIHHVVVEASSHALAQSRLNGLAIDVAVLTNLSHDHLDYHANLAEYAAAKRQLFSFASMKTAVINSDDDLGQQLITKLSGRDNLQLLTYSRQSKNVNTSLRARDIESTINCLAFNVVAPLGVARIKNKLTGHVNVDNLLATLASLIAVNVPFEDAIRAINQCHSVDGRMQVYDAGNYARVVVDFAHTPDALAKALCSLRDYLPKEGKLWCVFGCGGNRDASKRKLMGACANQYADRLVITDDNPRDEDHKAIVNDVLAGISNSEKVYIEHDRRQAICYAVSHAEKLDIILIAGKGHENYQEVMGNKQPFIDAQVVMESWQITDNAMPRLVGVSS